MSALRRHWARIAVTLLPVLLALAHATGLWHAGMLERLDHLIYDVRLRATMPGTFDPRIVIVDVDDASLARQGQWPWPRERTLRSTGASFRSRCSWLSGERHLCALHWSPRSSDSKAF